MHLKQDSYIKPNRWKNQKGEDRKTGFELEFTGVDLPLCVEILQKLFGGNANWIHSHQVEIVESKIGKIKLELDYNALLNFTDYMENQLEGPPFNFKVVEKLTKGVTQLAGNLVKGFVPVEIVTEPLKFEDFPQMDVMREALFQAKAKGTKDKMINAFGLHINPEAPSLEPDAILAYLRAFILIYPWLKEKLKVDLTRRFLSFIDAYPLEYQKVVMEDGYCPTQEKLILDYLKFNPTRNRSLDLCPIFIHLDETCKNLIKKSEQNLLSGRPAFHYRLPNCNIDSKTWRIAHEWNGWAFVESLANDSNKLQALCGEYRNYLKKSNEEIRRTWPNVIEKKLGLKLS